MGFRLGAGEACLLRLVRFVFFPGEPRSSAALFTLDWVARHDLPFAFRASSRPKPRERVKALQHESYSEVRDQRCHIPRDLREGRDQKPYQ